MERIYDQRSDEFAASEIRSVFQVSFDTEQQAQEFVSAVNSGADFAETAVAMTDFAANEIDLGDNTRADIEAEFGADATRTCFRP